MKKRISILSILLLLGMTVYAQTDIPQVIPSLQHWNGAKGKLTLPETGKIIIAPEAESLLKETAEIMAKDLKDMFGWNYQVTSGKPKNHSIYLSVKKSPSSLGEESYELDIRNHVTIEASTVKGVFWGTRTLLQMIHNQPFGLMKGKALDYPQYAHRGLMIDVARKFFTMDYLQDYVKILSFYKMNELQIHLNDNGFVEFFDNDWNKTYAAFRLESDRFPGLTSKDGSYTKEEFRNFQQMAARYGINIIPEIDVPAHSLAFTHYNPILAADKKEYGMDHLDLYKKEVYDFLDTLFDEYLSGDHPVFVGPDVHIGTDEYNLKEAEQFRYFTEYYLKYITKYGKNPRLWGSLKHMKGNTPVNLKGKTVNAWNYSWLDLETALQEGAKAINTCDAFLYIVPAVNYYHNFLDHQWIYESWSPRMMQEGEMIEQSTNLLGAMFAVWNDHVGNGISNKDIHHRVYPALQTLAVKMWTGKQVTTPYDSFNEQRNLLSEAPGVNQLGRIGKAPGLVYEQAAVTPNRTLPYREIGYNYLVSFDIKGADEAKGTELFRSPDAVFYLSDPISGMLGFARDGYLNTFNYRIMPGEHATVGISGDNRVTRLHINGKIVEELNIQKRFYNGGKDSMNYVRTLVFPLQETGNFKSQITNLKVYRQ